MEFNYNASVDSEYEAQLFGFSGTSVVSGLKDVLDNIFSSLLDSLERKLSAYNYDADALKRSKESLLAVYRESIDRHTDDLKEIVNMYLAIPKDVVLPEDDCQLEQCSEEEERNIDEQLQVTRNQLEALYTFERKLEETVYSISNFKKLVDELNKIQEKCEVLNISLKEINENPILQQDTQSLTSLLAQFNKKFTLE